MTEADVDDPNAGEVLAAVRRSAEDLVAGRVMPHDAGWAMWDSAMSGAIEKSLEGEQCHALWLMWGALTDWVENKPEETSEAEVAMRRATSGWLEVRLDPALWRPFFDHWLFVELGYDRRPPSPRTDPWSVGGG